MNKLAVTPGQKVWRIAQPYRVSKNNEDHGPFEVEVDKVGRKYFTIKNDPWRTKYSLEDGKGRDPNSNYADKIYTDIKEYREEKEHEKLYAILYGSIHANYTGKNFSLEQLRKICEILNLPLKNNT